MCVESNRHVYISTQDWVSERSWSYFYQEQHGSEPFLNHMCRISWRLLTGRESHQLFQQVRSLGAAEECASGSAVARAAGEKVAQPRPPPQLQALPHHGDQPQGQSAICHGLLLGRRPVSAVAFDDLENLDECSFKNADEWNVFDEKLEMFLVCTANTLYPSRWTWSLSDLHAWAYMLMLFVYLIFSCQPTCCVLAVCLCLNHHQVLLPTWWELSALCQPPGCAR